MIHTKFNQNWITNQDFGKKNWGGGGGRSTLNPDFIRMLQSFLKNKDFVSSLIVFEPACKIEKSLKNGNLVSQLTKICSLQTGVFPRIRHLKLLLAQNFRIKIK